MVRIIKLVMNGNTYLNTKEDAMKLKIAGILILMSFMNSEAVEKSPIKYAAVTTQLIEAETLDDAKVILNTYNADDQAILCEHLLRRHNIWVAEHGLFDKVLLKYGTHEVVKYAGGFMGAASLYASMSILNSALRNNFKWSEDVGSGVKFACFSMFCCAAAYFGHEENIRLQGYINEFQRIKDLITYLD